MPIRSFVAVALVLLSVGASRAQESQVEDAAAPERQRIGFSAAGTHSVSLAADRVRILIPLVAHALSTEEAIDLLRERKETARDRVRTLNADPESVRFGSVGIEDSESLLQSNQSALRVINAMGNPVNVDDLPVMHTARVDMTADWRLPEADEEATLAFVEGIVRGLKEPDVTGKDDRPEFSPKVEEALKTILTQSAQYFSGNRQDPDVIRYLFIANVSPETAEEAVRLAYEDARAQVRAMSNAAGLEMGQLSSMSSSSGTRLTQTVGPGFGGRTRADMLAPQRDEVASQFSGDLKYVAQVHTQFTVTQ